MADRPTQSDDPGAAGALAARAYFVHPAALCESSQIGAGTRIWAFAHVMAGAQVGAGCNIGDHAFLEAGAAIGDRVTVKNGVMLWEGVGVDDDVFLGPGVIFTNDLYPRSPRMQGEAAVNERYHDKAKWLVATRVARGASIGAGAVIICGITIGQFAMIGAGAVVKKDVKPHALMVGNPATQKGWVCRCGAKLGPRRDGLGCPTCQAAFRLAGDALEAV